MKCLLSRRPPGPAPDSNRNVDIKIPRRFPAASPTRTQLLKLNDFYVVFWNITGTLRGRIGQKWLIARKAITVTRLKLRRDLEGKVYENAVDPGNEATTSKEHVIPNPPLPSLHKEPDSGAHGHLHPFPSLSGRRGRKLPSLTSRRSGRCLSSPPDLPWFVLVAAPGVTSRLSHRLW